MNPEFIWFLMLKNVYHVFTMNYESMLNRSKGLSNLPRFEYFCTRSVYIYIYIKDKRLYCKVPSKTSPNSLGCLKGLIVETIFRIQDIS